MAIDWDALYELAPSDTTYVKDTDDAIRSLKTATRERVTKEHEFDLASQARQGLHRAGSAVAFYQASAPTQRNGVALAVADAGILFIDSDDNLAEVWVGDSFEGIKAEYANTAGASPLHTEVRITSGSGNWTVPSGITQIRVKCIGGGGGGGGSYRNGLNQFAGGGGGGTDIGSVPWSYIEVTPGSEIAYSVGTGGAGGNGSTSSPSDGGTGGATTFTGATTGPGGGGGKYIGEPGAAPAIVGGIPGSPGESSVDDLVRTWGGTGGGLGGKTNPSGTAGTGGFGGGGGGGFQWSSDARNFSGGNGGSGLIIIEY